MAIQSNFNLLGVNYSDANALWRQSVEQLANAGEKVRKQVNINQEKLDNNVLGFVNQLANKHGVDTPEFEQGMQQVLAQNPNNNLDMGTILANAMQSRGSNLGLQRAGLDNQKVGLDNRIAQGGIDDAQIINSVAPLIAKYNRTPEEEALVRQAFGSLKVTNILEPTMKARQLDDDYKIKGLNAAFQSMVSGAQGAGVQWDQPYSQTTSGSSMIEAIAGMPNAAMGGVGGSGGGTGGLFPSAPTAQTQTSGKVGGAKVPSSYVPLIQQASKKYGVHPSLIAAVMKTESGFDPDAKSAKGAQGVMQLMPGTAKEMLVDNPFDLGQNIEGGARYLSILLKKYKGNTGHALMAYNWGPGNTDKYLAGKAKPPKETVEYLKKVTGNLRAGTGTAANTGGSVATYTPPALDKIVTSKAIIGDPNNKALASRTYELVQSMSKYMDSKGQFITKHKDKYAPLAKEYSDIKSSMKSQLGKNFGEWEKSTKSMWKAAQKANTPVAKTTNTNTGSSNQFVNSPFAVSQWDEQVSGKALQSRLKVKRNESVANGSVARPTAQFAEIVQGHLGDNLKYFSAFNDTYHKGSGSKHAKGSAFDVVLKDGISKQEAAVVSRNLHQVAAAAGFKIKVLDEYNNPSKNSTGGHIHVTVEGQGQAQGGGSSVAGFNQPTTPEGYMNGLSLQDAIGMLGPAPERPANIAADPSAFNLIMEQLGLDKNDPLVGMYKQFEALGAKRGKQVADYQQAYMDYNQQKQDRVNIENQYIKTLTTNKLKVDTSIAKAMQDQAKVNQVRDMFQGGLVGTMGEDMAKEFVEFVKTDMQLTKDDFYNASPAEQMTILEDYLKTYSSYAAKSSNIQTKKDLDGAVPFNNIGKLAISVANNLTAKETANSPQDADKFKSAQNKHNFVATAINNTLASVQKNQNKQAIDTLNYGLSPQNMQQVYTNSIAQFNAKKQKENKKKPWYSRETQGFNESYQLTKDEQKELQAIVAANMYAVAGQYNKKSQAPLTQEENKNLNTNRYDAMLNFVKQIKK